MTNTEDNDDVKLAEGLRSYIQLFEDIETLVVRVKELGNVSEADYEKAVDDFRRSVNALDMNVVIAIAALGEVYVEVLKQLLDPTILGGTIDEE